MPQRRILVVTQHFWPENFRVNDLVEGFVDDGIAVDVLCGLPNYPKGEWYPGYRYTGPRFEERGGVRIWRAGEIPRRGNRGPMIFLNYVSWPLFALFSLGRLKGRYDAVLCYNTSPVLMALPALVYGRLHRVPVTVYVLDLWPENLYSVLPVKSRFWRAVARRVSDAHYRAADQLIAMSDSLRERLVQRTGKLAEKVAVIPQYCEDFYACPPSRDPAGQPTGVNPDPPRPGTPTRPDAAGEPAGPARPDEKAAGSLAQAPFPGPAGCFDLVFTGNFSPAQSLETVLRAVARARQLGAGGLRLLLVGDGMSRAGLEALAGELGLLACGAVVFCGSVPPGQVPFYTHRADGLVVSLSDSEDLGLTVPAKLASYMAASRPVLASMNGEGRAAVEAAGCGYASAACDVEGLARNMLALTRLSSAERAALGRRAFDWYRAHYRRELLLRQLEAFVLPPR